MRLEKAENLLKLAILMQTKEDGVSLIDIQEEFDVGRRTAERMRDSIQRLIPSTHSIGREGRIKKWKISDNKFGSLINFSADELAQVKASANKLRETKLDSDADTLDEVYAKIKSSLPLNQNVRLEPDIEAIIEAEGYDTRVGVKNKISSDILNILREAIKSCKKVKITYQNSQDKQSTRTVAPYGFLYGNKHYIIAMCSKADGIRTFNLSKIVKATLTEISYEIPSDFNLKAYNQRSFGVFQEIPHEVIWRFSPEVANAANEYEFHPSQETEILEDGSLLVSFTAGGLKEMCYELFKWEGAVEIIAPEELKDEFREIMKSNL